ncbi:MAG TPA: tetratricopeptide repeat protein [Candidatus Angelobacter sp.]
MFQRAAVVALVLISFSIVSAAQRNSLSMPARPGMQPSAQDMFNSVSGNVTTMDNRPVKDVHVELRDSSGSTVSSVYTNSSGSFEFPAVHSGSYQIVATSGLEQIQERVEVQRMPSTVSLRLPVSSTPADGNSGSAISVAQYKVPAKARDAFKKAQEALGKGKNDEAQKHLARALEIHPKYADAITLGAILKLDEKNDQAAIADLQQAINYDQNCAMAYLVMGSALNTQSKYDDAIRSLERGEALSPNSWQAYFEMAKALVGKAQYQKALQQLDRAQALVPKDYLPIHLVRAHAMLALNNYSDAMTELQQYLEKEPKGPNSVQAQKMLDQARAFASANGGAK